MRIMGFGDTGTPEDPIGISVVWLHVPKQIFKNYAILGNPETWNDIRARDLLLCGARYTLVGEVHVKEFCNEWTCGQVIRAHCRERVGWYTTGQTRKKWKCPWCYYLECDRN